MCHVFVKCGRAPRSTTFHVKSDPILVEIIGLAPLELKWINTTFDRRIAAITFLILSLTFPVEVELLYVESQTAAAGQLLARTSVAPEAHSTIK